MTTLKLNGETPNVIIFALQASSADKPLTDGQINAAREASKSVLEALGCDVSAISDVITLNTDGGILNISAEVQG